MHHSKPDYWGDGGGYLVIGFNMLQKLVLEEHVLPIPLPAAAILTVAHSVKTS
jgi:hypothetical protein